MFKAPILGALKRSVSVFCEAEVSCNLHRGRFGQGSGSVTDFWKLWHSVWPRFCRIEENLVGFV